MHAASCAAGELDFEALGSSIEHYILLGISQSAACAAEEQDSFKNGNRH